jgi:hypothetical protein
MTRFLALAVALVATSASAQTGLGAQIGSPTGISFKVGTGEGAIAGAVGWDLEDSISAEVHYLLNERYRPDIGRDVRLFYGPGVFLDGDANDDAVIGVSLGVGLSARVLPEVDVYGLLSPRLGLLSETSVGLGGGLGVRLYFLD